MKHLFMLSIAALALIGISLVNIANASPPKGAALRELAPQFKVELRVVRQSNLTGSTLVEPGDHYLMAIPSKGDVVRIADQPGRYYIVDWVVYGDGNSTITLFVHSAH